MSTCWSSEAEEPGGLGDRPIGYLSAVRRSRYFFPAVLLAGLGVGLVAYYALGRAAGMPPAPGLPDELRYVPADAVLVAYADVHAVMASDLSKELQRMAIPPPQSAREMQELTGVDLEKQVNRIVLFLQSENGGESAGAASEPSAPHALVLAQGTFEQAAVMRFLQEHGGIPEEYRGTSLVVRRSEQADRVHEGEKEEAAVAFVRPDLIAHGPVEMVRRAIDEAASPTSDVTSNAELMTLIRGVSSENAWLVGRFDAVGREIRLPGAVQRQVPPVRFVSAGAHVDGSVKTTIKMETVDEGAAAQLRDAARVVISLARVQAAPTPELHDAIESIDLGGEGTDVQLSFVLTPAALRALASRAALPAVPQP